MKAAPPTGRRQPYLSYVLRLWQVENGGQPLWRASLQDSHSGVRRGFADLADLAAFLAERTGGPASAGDDETDQPVAPKGPDAPSS